MTQSHIEVWRVPLKVWVVMLGALALTCALSFDGLQPLVMTWISSEEYGYGFFVPAVIAFLIWQKRDVLERLPFDGSWIGLGLVLIGVSLLFIGELSTLYIVIQYSLLIVLAGLALTFMGWRGFKLIAIPLLLLFFMIPLPTFVYQGLSAETQLLSSQLGVAIIRLFGISVFLEGNVIDLGTYKLQVAEACNGLRYLFPLMTLGFIAAYLFKGALWKRALLFLSTIPITILMNSFRIAVIGVLVEHWGVSMAEGFLHDFEGWVIFMACTGVLVLEMWALAKIGGEPRSLREVFALELPAPAGKDVPIRARPVPTPLWGALLVLVGVTILFNTLPSRVEHAPERKDFSQFPMTLNGWQGRPDRLDAIYVDALKFNDYILANYVAASRQPVNFYVAYYASQRKGESAHSPRSCMPGDGWEITSLEQRNVDGANVSGQPLRVNRALIQKGDNRQLVYYWFQQRGRVITNEYLVKWYLFWDALTRNRSDGALVRLVVSVDRGGNLEEADSQLTSFATTIADRLADYIPG
jgi:exosortase D (VPLPA-CTERM-specific)